MSVPCCGCRAPQPGQCGENLCQSPSDVNCWDCWDTDYDTCKGGGYFPGLPGAKCKKPDGSGGCWNCAAHWPDGTPDSIGCCWNAVWYWQNPRYPNGQVWPWGTHTLNRLQAACEGCAGTLTTEDDCGIVYPEPQCRAYDPIDDLPQNARRWTTDLESPAMFGFYDQKGYGGTTIPITCNQIRQTEPLDNQDTLTRIASLTPVDEGKLVLMPDGDLYAEGQTWPMRGVEHWYCFAGLAVAPIGTQDAQDGDTYFMGLVRLPYWTEAILRSRKIYCEGTPF